MENEEKKNQTPEVRDEDLDQVSGGVMLPGKPPVNPPERSASHGKHRGNE